MLSYTTKAKIKQSYTTNQRQIEEEEERKRECKLLIITTQRKLHQSCIKETNLIHALLT